VVPVYLRAELPLDAGPARGARQSGALAMAPADPPAFGMDEAGLGRLIIPTYISVGARDTQARRRKTLSAPQNMFRTRSSTCCRGLVDDEIFLDECDQFGPDIWPGASIDAPGVDRNELHEYIGTTVLQFFDKNLGVWRASAD
jgi:hypothetical protein